MLLLFAKNKDLLLDTLIRAMTKGSKHLANFFQINPDGWICP